MIEVAQLRARVTALSRRRRGPETTAEVLVDLLVGDVSGPGLAEQLISRYACTLELSSRRLVELDVRGFPIRRDWHIVHLRRRKLPASVSTFIEFLRGTSWLSPNGSRGRVMPPTD